jgi:hypothetical protein
MPEPGERIADRYELVAPLGRGGMGEVWRARDTRLGRSVALKLLSAASVGNALARERLIREARATAALEHDGIVHVYDVGETPDGGAFLVMEILRGCTLREALERGGLGLPRRVAIVVEAGRALGFAHASGIVHRDVKPDNVMIRDDGRVKVVDFGVAKPVSSPLVAEADTVAFDSDHALTARGQLVGTPQYLAPEQARGADVSPATDQFALAVTAYEVITGRIPWRGSTVADLLASILRDEPEPASALASIPPAIDAALARALAKDPAARWPTIVAFVDALAGAAGDLVATAGAPTVEAPLPLPSTPRLTPGTHGGQAATSPRARTPRSRAPFGLLAVAVLGAAGAAAWFARGRAARPEAGAAAPIASLDADAPLACPLFDVRGLEDGAWLGAPAAALACERWQIAHGGLDARTIAPAELLDRPRDVFAGAGGLAAAAADAGSPYDAPGARDRSRAAARTRAPRWIDGEVEKEPTGFSVRIVLRRSDDREIARGEGRGVELFEAVRGAMGAILAAAPASAPQLAGLAASLDVATSDDALALLDVRTAALIEDRASLREACAAVEKRLTLTPRVAYLARQTCAKQLRLAPPSEPPPAMDSSSPAALITTSLAQGTSGGPDAVRARAMSLDAARATTALPEDRARVAAAAAEIYKQVGDDRARQLARDAIQSSPKAVDWRTNEWHRFAFSSQSDATVDDAIVSWNPWEPIAQSLPGRTGNAAEVSIRRAWLVSQRGFYAQAYGLSLVASGKIEAARAVAETTDDGALRAEILLAERKFRATFDLVVRTLPALPASDAEAALAFSLARSGTVAAQMLGRPSDFVDDVVTRYVDATPHHVIDGAVPFTSLVAACCFAPARVGRRCIARLRSLREAGELPTIFPGADVVADGAARFVEDDYAGAAKVWRTLLRAPGWIQDPLHDPMAVAFDRSGMLDLAEQVDAPEVDERDAQGTADLALARSARRALKRGDAARARKLALAGIKRWEVADEDLPVISEMKAIVAKTAR